MNRAPITPAPRPLTRAARHLPLMLLLAGLSACGGGSAPTPPPPPPPPAFALTSTVPADAASGVARDAVVAASFNAALDAASVSASNVTLTGPGGNAIPATLAITGGGSTVEVKPKAGALPADTRYTLSLAAAIKDSTGRTLDHLVTRSFSTAGANWSSNAGDLETLVDFNTANALAIHTDATGRTTAAWPEQRGVTSLIYAARLDGINGTWSAPVAVASDDHARLGGAALTAGPAGDVFLTWSRGDFNGQGKAQLSRFSAASGTWSAPADVATAAPPGFSVPVSDASGNPTLLGSDGSSVFATRLDVRTNTWSPSRAIERPYPNNYVFPPRAVIDAQGNIVAAWMQVDEGGRAIYAARYDASTSQWAAAQHVASTPANGAEPTALVVDGVGVVTLAWTLSAGVAGGDTVWASRLDAQGRAWSPAVRMDRTDPAAPDAGAVSLVVDGAGTVTALWRQGNLRTARWAPGDAGWSAPVAVAPAGGALESGWRMMSDTVGNIVVVGLQLDRRLMATRYLATTGQWQPPVQINIPAVNVSIFTQNPVASMDAAGNVVAVWFAQNQVGQHDYQYVLSFNRLR